MCTYGFILQAADTYVDQLQSCRPKILYPQLVHDTPITEILKNILDVVLYTLSGLQQRRFDNFQMYVMVLTVKDDIVKMTFCFLGPQDSKILKQQSSSSSSDVVDDQARLYG